MDVVVVIQITITKSQQALEYRDSMRRYLQSLTIEVILWLARCVIPTNKQFNFIMKITQNAIKSTKFYVGFHIVI